MLKQDVLSGEIYNANYSVLVEFFIKEGMPLDMARKNAYNIIMPYIYQIAKKAVELAGGEK